jgi:LIM domain-binding protein 1
MPFMGQPDYRIYEMNRRLQQWTEDTDNLWWDSFATEFFEDDATLTLAFCLEDGMKRYTIGRTLIPRYFRSMFEGGVSEYYVLLKHAKESFHNTAIILDCDLATIVTHHNQPVFTKVLTEGRLILEFTFDDLMRIRMWHFTTRQHCELIPRSIIALQQQEPAVAEHLSQNITRQGLTNHTLHFLMLCVILEPMQELMSRHKAYGLNPRDCLKTTLFQKWQRMVAPPDTNRQPNKRRKRKPASNTNTAASAGTANTMPTGAGPGLAGRLKRSPDPQNFTPILGDVMVVGEPTLMGGEFGDKDERLIARLENTQYDPTEQQELIGPAESEHQLRLTGPSTSSYGHVPLGGSAARNMCSGQSRPCVTGMRSPSPPASAAPCHSMPSPWAQQQHANNIGPDDKLQIGFD